jgi:hypothetical protein
MRLKVRLIGTGKEGDPLHANLPHYSMVHVDYDGKYAIVDIPDTEHPFGKDGPNGTRIIDPLHGEILTAATIAALNAWHKHMDERYSEHSGKFRVDLVK